MNSRWRYVAPALTPAAAGLSATVTWWRPRGLVTASAAANVRGLASDYLGFYGRCGLPDGTLSRAAGNALRVRVAQAETLVLAAHWGDLHGECLACHPEHPGRSLPGMERLVSFGGEGTPEVAEFAVAELASELGSPTVLAGT